jgi:hypothetical protein
VDYGKILRRAWDIVWEHKFLILLGVLIALGGTQTASQSINFQIGDRWFEGQLPRVPDIPQWRDLPRQWGIPIAVGLLMLGVIIIGVVVGLILRVISLLAQGSLVAAVATIDKVGTSSFGTAFRAGWQKGWRLIAIGFIPALPVLLLLLGGLAMGLLLFGLTRPVQTPNIRAMGLAALIFLVPAGILLAIATVLEVLRAFATRALMLEDLGVFASYRRGWQVLLSNFGEAAVLALIQLGITILIGLLSVFPGALLALCCLLWPILLLLRGAIAAYFSTLWTLAWRGWTLTPRPDIA